MVGLIGVTQIAKPARAYRLRGQRSRVRRRSSSSAAKPCHSAHPTDDVFKSAPNGVMFDTRGADRPAGAADQASARCVGTMMPFLNKTHITDVERAELGAWIDAGTLVK